MPHPKMPVRPIAGSDRTTSAGHKATLYRDADGGWWRYEDAGATGEWFNLGGVPDYTYTGMLYDHLKTRGLRYLRGFALDMEEYVGSWRWDAAGGKLVVYATPWWEGDRDLVFYATGADGEELLIHGDGPFNATGDLEADGNAYLARVGRFFAACRAIGSEVL